MSRNKVVDYHKVSGKDNVSDILTKHVSGDLLDYHIANMNLAYPDGVDEQAYELDNLVNGQHERAGYPGVDIEFVRPVDGRGRRRDRRAC